MAQKGRFLVMATAAKSQNVLQRKLAAARQGTGGNSRSALRALRLALARAAADAVGLPVAVIGATQTRSGPERLAEALTGDRLFLRLDGPEGRTGALAIDRALVAAVIRRQTTGRTDAPASPPAQRPFTATDAALSAPLVAALLDRAPALAEAADRDCLSGYACGAAAADLRALLLGLDGDRFRLFVLVAEIAGGPAQASLVLALPDDAEAPGPAVNAPVGAVFSVEDGTFAEVRAELVAVVGTLRLPLSRLAEMQPGDMLAPTGASTGPTLSPSTAAAWHRAGWARPGGCGPSGWVPGRRRIHPLTAGPSRRRAARRPPPSRHRHHSGPIPIRTTARCSNAIC
jgi:hypothetical protein